MGPGPDGRPDRRHVSGASESVVAAKVRKLESQRDSGKASKTGRVPTVEQWMSTYLDTVCEQLVSGGKMSPRTRDDYVGKTRTWITPLLGGHRLNRLRPEHIEKAHGQMFAAGLAASTVLKVHRILSRALRIAVRRDLIGKNPADQVEPPAPGETEIEPYTRDEVRLILQAAAGRRNAARWSVALALGLRQGECLGLRWKFIDMEAGLVRAWYQAGRANFQHGCPDANACGKLWHRPACPKTCRQHQHAAGCDDDCQRRDHRCPVKTCDPKSCTGHARHCPQRYGGGVTFRARKGTKRLTVPLPAELVPVLEAHREVQDLERMAAGDRWQDLDLVFATETGGLIAREADWQEWKELLREAGVRDGRLHDARHTAATMLIELGVHTRTVQEVLGHARVTTTERYTHVASPMVTDATNRLGEALWGGEG